MMLQEKTGIFCWLCYSILEGVIYLAEFCTCGSLIINGHCTNKGCSFKSALKAEIPKSKSRKAENSATAEPKKPKTRRASKCVTYNLYDLKQEEENNE